MLFSDLISEDKNEVSMNFPKETDQNPFSEARISRPPISLAFSFMAVAYSSISLNTHILIWKVR